jgi:hypothetical protein
VAAASARHLASPRVKLPVVLPTSSVKDARKRNNLYLLNFEKIAVIFRRETDGNLFAGEKYDTSI